VSCEPFSRCTPTRSAASLSLHPYVLSPPLTPFPPNSPLASQQAQRATGGTGLGLYSLSKRIEALGGLCGVRDRDDCQQGAVFWFTFPYRPDLEQAAAAVAASASTDAVSDDGTTTFILTDVDNKPSLPPLRILLTDDAASILKVTSRFLTANKHTVVTAENDNQSLERLKKDFGQIDLLITDLQVQYRTGQHCKTADLVYTHHHHS
jgi:hypothetical protein